MDVKEFMNILGCDFFTGVPDSQLRALCDYLIQIQIYGTDPAHHIIAANDGNALAIASGYHLATGKIPAVYMQNSGLGNIVNPSASLTNPKVYNIPVIFIVGWRGVLSEGRDTAFVIRKGAFTGDKVSYQNSNTMIREEIIRHIVSFSGDSPVVSTTGKTSRELFELRETHERDFLTVGSMGHASSIALGAALNKPELKIWCIDGDGAALMHLGAMAVIGSIEPKNLVHVVINNSAHESVGGLPTAAGRVSLPDIAKACGYAEVFSVGDYDSLDEALNFAAGAECLTFIEAKSRIGSRENLGRPTTTAIENKNAFMEFLSRKSHVSA